MNTQQLSAYMHANVRELHEHVLVMLPTELMMNARNVLIYFPGRRYRDGAAVVELVALYTVVSSGKGIKQQQRPKREHAEISTLEHGVWHGLYDSMPLLIRLNASAETWQAVLVRKASVGRNKIGKHEHMHTRSRQRIVTPRQGRCTKM